MRIRDKLLPGSYPISLLNLLETPTGKLTGKVKEILTSSNFRRKIWTEDNQSLTNYRSSISTTVGTASIGTKPLSNTSLIPRNSYPKDMEDYIGENPQPMNQDRLSYHPPFSPSENRSRQEQPSVKEFIVSSKERRTTLRRYHHQ